MSALLANILMKNVVLTLDVVAALVVDIETTFFKDFEAMYNVLDLYSWPLTRGNYKGNDVDKFHKSCNKKEQIQGNDHKAHLGVVCTIKTSKFA